jgi:thiosulfate/3-mercaptopyruvate sulfurtransferase
MPAREVPVQGLQLAARFGIQQQTIRAREGIMNRHPLQILLAACGLILLCLFGAVPRAPAATGSEPADAGIPSGRLMQPAELARLLQSSGAKPLILQVGSRVLFAQAHIPASEYTGAAGQDAGLEALRARVKDLDRDRFIVLYCGCCPWPRCPNIRRAWHQLDAMGFKRVEALYIAEDFGTDWVAKGYPVATGE